MLSVRRGCPIDYRLCNQTVTVYHKDGDKYIRAVYKRAFLDFKKTQNVDKTGTHEANSFLLVIPCDHQIIFPKDKVFLGEGPEITIRAAGAEVIPANVAGLVVQVKMKPVAQIIKAHGLDRDGYAQRYWTNIVNRRITRYMPYRSGALATKLKYISGPAEITVAAPHARYQYYGKVMIDPNINAAGFLTKDGTWRSRKGAVKVLTGRNLRYDTTKNALAGPLWDKRLIAAEGDAMVEEMRGYIRMREARR